jgi:uncharacterized membrane protein YbaN (DUF454 family)
MRLTKIILIITGFLFLAAGLIGIVVPVLPSTPFLLAASFCFLKSSARIHRWIIAHPVLGPRIERFQKQGMTKREKIYVYAFASAMILPVIILTRSIHLRIFLIALLGIKAFVFMRIKTAPPNPQIISDR